MTELKCPVCNTPLEYDIEYDGDYSCSKCGKNKMYGSEELWQALIDTKNQLIVERTTHDILQEELKKLQKENELLKTQGFTAMTNDYTVIKYDKLCELLKAQDELLGLKGLKPFQN